MGKIMRRLTIALFGFLLLMVASSPGFAQTASNDNISKITVQGEGKATAVPDIAVITLGVETRNASASIAALENARLMNSTVSSLLKSGISMKNISTSRFSLTTENQPTPVDSSGNPTGKQLPPIFVATNQVTVKLSATGDVGGVLDAAIAAGSNSILGIDFSLNNSRPQDDAALKRAVEDAAHKAGIVADAASVRLGRILDVSGGYSYTSTPSASFRALAAPAAPVPTPVSPGELEVTATISVTYAIL